MERELKQLKQFQNDSVELLKACSSQVGTILGEEIAKHLSAISGIRFNTSDWDLKDRNGEQ